MTKPRPAEGAIGALNVAAEQPDDAREQRREQSRAGRGDAIAIGFGGFGAWGVTARLDNAAVANGTVIVDSKRKTISHLEGGILKMLLKTEGAALRTSRCCGSRMRGPRPSSSSCTKRVGLEAQLARLRAEQNNAKEIDFPDDRARRRRRAEVIRAERRCSLPGARCSSARSISSARPSSSRWPSSRR